MLEGSCFRKKMKPDFEKEDFGKKKGTPAWWHPTRHGGFVFLGGFSSGSN
ncbi:hypothetical protein Syun_016683 [Stephania yunnanensis]|uniref:Uncharacterized protein n=1 Tax=Stephania yunnanensis TaxID=152371 RepID=A0AAP0P552_9MAGN